MCKRGRGKEALNKFRDTLNGRDARRGGRGENERIRNCITETQADETAVKL